MLMMAYSLNNLTPLELSISIPNSDCLQSAQRDRNRPQALEFELSLKHMCTGLSLSSFCAVNFLHSLGLVGMSPFSAFSSSTSVSFVCLLIFCEFLLQNVLDSDQFVLKLASLYELSQVSYTLGLHIIQSY